MSDFQNVDPVTETGALLAPILRDRRRRILEMGAGSLDSYLRELLDEVDAALKRIDQKTFGLCESCQEPIETDRLLRDPLICFCLDHLTEAERRAHELDLETATQIQGRLLPPKAMTLDGWETRYEYRAAGPVGGDYCELLAQGANAQIFFSVGDISGKGVAASLLMTHLSAILRSLISIKLPLQELMPRANRIFCEGTLASHYATLVCGSATADGLEIINAGHCAPMVVRPGGVQRLEASGLPLGMFCRSEYPVERIELRPGESVVLYTDGLVEARNAQGGEFGEQRLMALLSSAGSLDAHDLAAAVLAEHGRFTRGVPPVDDLTLLVIRRRA